MSWPMVLEPSQDCAAKLKTLADSTRLSILKLLMDGPQHVNELNSVLRLEQSLLSHHLRVLRDAGFVKATRDGKAVLYALRPEMLSPESQQILDLGCCEFSFTSFLQ